MANNIAIAITADVADLTAKVAVAKATMADASKSMRASAQAVVAAGGWTSASDEIKRAAIEAGEAQSKAASGVRLFERELRRMAVPANDTIAASGQMKFAMRDLAFQVNDVATMFSLGAPPMQIFASQGGQVIGALQMMTGEAKGVLGVLGGPWGMMAASATMVLTPFIAKLFETKGALEGVGNAAQVAMDKLHQSLANSTAVTDAATEATKKYVQASADLGKAQRDLARTQGANDMGMAAGPFAAGVQSEASKAAADARARIEKAKKDLADAQQMFSDIDAMGNAAAIQAANRSRLNASTAGGGSGRASGATRGSGGAAAGQRADQEAAREALQERIAVNQQEDTLAEDRAQTDIALSKIALQAKLADIATEARAGTLSGAQAVQAKAKVNAELMQLDQDLENRLFAAKLKELQANRANYRAGTNEFAAYTRQIEVLQAQHNNRMVILNAQAKAKERQLDARIESERARRMKSISANWAAELARMATLQQGFGATVTGIWQSVQGAVASVIQQMLADWLLAHVLKIGAAKTEAVTSATAQAALAGAGGVASMAAAPFPINLGAPAFGAAMFATSAAYGSLASFAAGTNQLPNDMIAQVHAGERIVPKADNQALLELTRRGAGMLEGPGKHSANSLQGMTINISAVDARSVKRLFMDHNSELANAMRKYARDGGR